MQTKHPKGLYFLFAIEVWERFSFYGMLALLVLFMKGFFHWDTKKATDIYGWYIGLSFLTPVIGGYLADKFFGQNKCIIAGALLMAVGQFILFSVPYTSSITAFYTGIAFLIAGVGLLKANISTLVGNLYHKDDPRKDAGFTIFYMGINIGVGIAPLICGYLGEKVNWQWGFFAAGVGILIGLLTFLLGKKKYLGDIGEIPAAYKSKEKAAKHIKDEPLTKAERQKSIAILIMGIFVIFFWFAFKQNGASLTLFAKETTRRILPFTNWEFPATWFLSTNAIFILLFGPVFSKIWIKLATKQKEPSTPAKFVWGLMLLAGGFVIISLAASQEKTVGIWWLTGTYLFMTLGELCISPVGLSLVTKLSPVKYLSTLMGVWFIANFISNRLAGVYAGLYDKMAHTNFFAILVATSVFAALTLFIFKKYIKRLMHGVH